MRLREFSIRRESLVMQGENLKLKTAYGIAKKVFSVAADIL